MITLIKCLDCKWEWNEKEENIINETKESIHILKKNIMNHHWNEKKISQGE